MNIGVIGAGRLGLCFALLLDRGGYQVRASDIRSNYIAALQKKEIQTNEPQVADMLATCNIDFTMDTRAVIKDSDIIYVMVATPSRADGSYDISAVERVIEDVAESDFDLYQKILVIGCTTNPGDCQAIQNRLRNTGISVLYNPEFIAQGSIIRDLENADMVLIGGEDANTIDRYQQVYHKIQTQRQPNIHTMSLTAAEIVKIGINCYLTTKISYANMLGQVLLRSGLGEDVERALSAVGADSRVGNKYLKFGYGFGGPCLPRDNRSFGHYARRLGLKFNLGETVDAFNSEHAEFLFHQYKKLNPDRLPYYMPYISYKANTDIFEESQQLRLCLSLLEDGYHVIIEPSDLIPKDILAHLVTTYTDQVSFVSQPELDQMRQPYIQVMA